MAGGGHSGANVTMVLTLGVFLKLLGFFVVLFSYAELEPIKVRQAEYSLQERFGISLNLPLEEGGMIGQSPMIVQQQGRAYDAIKQELMTQVDFLSTENSATSDILSLTVPAPLVLSLGNVMAKSPSFATQLVQVLQTQRPSLSKYYVTLRGMNGVPEEMMRSLGQFVQKMIASGYNSRLLAIAYDTTSTPDISPKLVIEIRAVLS